MLRTAAECLKARRTTPRAEIKYSRVGETRFKDREEGLTNTVCKRTRPLLWHLKETPPKRSRNDANPLGHHSALPREEDGGRPTAEIRFNERT